MRTSTDARSDGGGDPPEAVRQVIADAVTADTRRQDLLVEYAEALGPDPSLAHLDDDALDHAVRVGAAELAAATCRWLELLAELVIRGRWAQDGARSPAYWLSWALGIANSTAREHVRVALRLRECPMIRDRFAAGSLSYSKVRSLTRVATPEVEPLLLQWADAAPAHVLDRVIADARRLQRGDTAPEERDDLGLTRRWLPDGTYELVLRVEPDLGLDVEQSIERLVELDHGDDGDPNGGEEDDGAEDHDTDAAAAGRVPRTRREAELLVGALGAAVAAAPDDTSGADRHLVVVHTTAAELLDASDRVSAEAAGASDGASAEAPVLVHDGRGRVKSMSARTLWRLACSARLRLSVDRDGHPADLGRGRRTPDARLRRLLHARDRSCRFPGCGATHYLHAHHVRHWEDGGPTDLDNLVLLCRFHHATVHKGWELRPAGTGRWTFHAPEARTPLPWSRRLPGAPAEADALLAAARAHVHDLAPEVRTRLLQPAHWDGDEHGYDHDMTVGILLERLSLAA